MCRSEYERILVRAHKCACTGDVVVGCGYGLGWIRYTSEHIRDIGVFCGFPFPRTIFFSDRMNVARAAGGLVVCFLGGVVNELDRFWKVCWGSGSSGVRCD